MDLIATVTALAVNVDLFGDWRALQVKQWALRLFPVLFWIVLFYVVGAFFNPNMLPVSWRFDVVPRDAYADDLRIQSYLVPRGAEIHVLRDRWSKSWVWVACGNQDFVKQGHNRGEWLRGIMNSKQLECSGNIATFGLDDYSD